ncbi:hypothetical protein K501DRAFT_309305 [Backusella circina FSU 941]|nr:hypothetical protein K501DRAFT_281108 [Backusella circina FSU 941]KAI8876020.1 hypothetical protein K501DRAFT_309305 [Backusella circina FSU 941]
MNNSMLAPDVHQPFVNNKAYRIYLPNMVLALSLFYITSLSIWAVQRYLRRIQSRKRRIERARLRKRWEMMYRHEEAQMISYPQQTYSVTTPNSSVTFIPTSNTSATTIKQESLIKYDVGQYNKRKLDLLWQWSVSMGYCVYQHGRDLDELIEELQTRQKKEA